MKQEPEQGSLAFWLRSARSWKKIYEDIRLVLFR